MKTKNIAICGVVACAFALSACSENVPSTNQGNETGQRLTNSIYKNTEKPYNNTYNNTYNYTYKENDGYGYGYNYDKEKANERYLLEREKIAAQRQNINKKANLAREKADYDKSRYNTNYDAYDAKNKLGANLNKGLDYRNGAYKQNELDSKYMMYNKQVYDQKPYVNTPYIPRSTQNEARFYNTKSVRNNERAEDLKVETNKTIVRSSQSDFPRIETPLY